MTTITTYRNKRNEHKFIEVHNDGHYHNSLKQYLFWERNVITGEATSGTSKEHYRRQEAPSLEKDQPEGITGRL